jgi:hypothetical protein
MRTPLAFLKGRRIPLLALSLLMSAGLSRAESPEESEVDPPEQVARLSYVHGDVVVVEAEQGDSSTAALNLPMTDGDELRVGRDSRAELQLAVATLHVDAGSRLSFVQLASDAVRLRLTEGVMVVNVREPDSELEGDDESAPPAVELETPNALVTLLEPGEYSIAIEDGGIATVVGVRDGASEISSGSQVFDLRDSQEGRYTGMNGLEEEVHALDRRNRFESWADERVEDEDRSESSRYVSREMVGYRDLDRYGYWESDPYYGYVWTPRHVGMGWAPYRFGYWSWIGPWGWTWIDNSPWGFAPFHYGRWAYSRSRWCWVPGPRHHRPIYSPHLVRWRGAGNHLAWVPLGPREVYVPRHRSSDRYLRRVNQANTVIPDPRRLTREDRGVRYVNERHSGAITTASRQAFASGRTVSRTISPFNERNVRLEPTTPPEPERSARRPSYTPPAMRNSQNPVRPGINVPTYDDRTRRYGTSPATRTQETPRTETPRTQTPRTETIRTQTPRTQTPRTQTPRTQPNRPETYRAPSSSQREPRDRPQAQYRSQSEYRPQSQYRTQSQYAPAPQPRYQPAPRSRSESYSAPRHQAPPPPRNQSRPEPRRESRSEPRAERSQYSQHGPRERDRPRK